MNKKPESPAHSSASQPASNMASNQASKPASKPDWEEQINALLDGELDNEQAEQLKTAAGQDRALAQAIVDAYQLQQALEAIPLQRAPASLRRKLASIPAEHRKKRRPVSWPTSWATSRPGWFRPAWITALAAIPLAVIVLNLWQAAPVEPIVPATAGVTEPTAAELQEAQRELAVVFAYLGKVGRKTSLEIGQTVNSEMQQNINENMIRTLRDQMEFNKERNA